MSIREIEFDGFAQPEPPEGFGYIVDDFGIRYGAGPWPWPFYRHATGYKRSEETGQFKSDGKHKWRPSSVRLAPDTEYGAARTQYVTVYPADERLGLHLTVDFAVYVRPHGLGGDVGHCSATLDPQTFATVELLCPDEVREVATAKLEKVAVFLRAAIAERDTGKVAPETAHERWEAAQVKEVSR